MRGRPCVFGKWRVRQGTRNRILPNLSWSACNQCGGRQRGILFGMEVHIRVELWIRLGLTLGLSIFDTCSLCLGGVIMVEVWGTARTGKSLPNCRDATVLGSFLCGEPGERLWDFRQRAECLEFLHQCVNLIRGGWRIRKARVAHVDSTVILQWVGRGEKTNCWLIWVICIETLCYSENPSRPRSSNFHCALQCICHNHHRLLFHDCEL